MLLIRRNYAEGFRTAQAIMLRSYNRFVIFIGLLLFVLLILTLLYMLGMYFLEDKPRSFMQALQWAAGTASTTGYGGDTSWQHPVMVVYVVFAQFIGVILLFLVFPIYLIPFLEERFETKLPKESASAKNHVVIFDYGPAVATLITELEQANIPTVIIDEDEDRRASFVGTRPPGHLRQSRRRRIRKSPISVRPAR